MNEVNETQSRAAKRSELSRLVMRLRRYNEWRRGADFEQPEPAEIGRDIDQAAEMLEAMETVLLTVKENDIARYMRTGEFGNGELVRAEIQRVLDA